MRLHYHPTSPYSRKASVAVRLRGDDVELVVVDVTTGAHQAPSFLALSPFGKLPVLETDEGPIFESTSLLEYLEERGPRLLIPVGREREARHWDRIGDLYLMETQSTYLFQAGTPAAEVALGMAEVALGLFERQLADGRSFVLGEAFTLADLSGAIGADHFRRMDVALPPHVDAWVDRCFEVGPMGSEREAGRPLMEAFLTRRRRALTASG